MRKLLSFLLLAVLVLVSVPLPVAAIPTYEKVVDYQINVSLDNEFRTLTGQSLVAWRNIGTSPTDELYLHLYPNAFKEGSTFLKESGGQMRGDRMTRDGYGSMELLRLEGQGQSLEWAFVRPGDGNPKDQTLARVQLPHMVNPGEELLLAIDFVVNLPQLFARMGRHDDFVMAGQWYPRVAAYEPAGTRGRETDGWSFHQYHAATEFYGNFGRFRVTIDVPAGVEVAATGKRIQGPLKQDGRTRYVYLAEPVHDFAWAADKGFIVRELVYQNELQPPVTILAYLQREHLHLADLYFQAATETLRLLGEWLFPYPYETLTLVCPRANAGGAGGMEYPTLVTSWDASVLNQTMITQVLVHEIIHQYFQGMIANNEAEEAWLDEGFTSYLEDKVMEEAFGMGRIPGTQAVHIRDSQPLVLEGWNYPSLNSYYINVYTRAKLVMHELERIIGWPKFQQVLQAYALEFKFGHPATSDFQRVLEQETGTEWGGFFDNYIYGAGMQDYAIERVKTRVERRRPSPVYVTEVFLTRPAGWPHAVNLVATFADNSTYQREWAAEKASEVIVLTHPQPIVSLVLDPEYRLMLDNMRRNNYYTPSLVQRALLWLSYRWLGLLLRIGL